MLADGFSLDFEWQVSLRLQGSSQYSGRLSNALIGVVSTCPLISKSPSPSTNHLRFQVCQLQLVSALPSCSISSSAFYQGPDIYLSFHFLLILLCGLPREQSPLFGRFFIFWLTITRSGHLAEIWSSVCICREEENLVFWFGAQFISTLNFTQSGWLILFSPDLHFRLAKRVSGQTHSLWRETATRTDVPLVVPT